MLPLVSMALAPAPGLPNDRLVLGLHPPERVAVLDVATGAVKQRRLPGGTLCHGPLMTSGARWLTARDDELYLRSARRGAFWALRVRLGYARAVAIREITGAGRTLFRTRRRPPAGYPSGGVPGGIVFEHRGRHRIWNPRTGALRPAGGEWLVSAFEHGSAWCDGRCRRIRIRAGGRSTATAPEGSAFVPESGRFSPDASLLAVALSGPRAGIAVVSTGSGSLELLPEPAGERGAMAWSPSGDWLYAAGPGSRIVAYSPRTWRSVTVPAPRFRGEVIDLAASG